MDASAKVQKNLILAALILAGTWTVSYVYFMRFLIPPSPLLSAAEVVEIYTNNNMRFRIGVVLSIITCGFYLPWSLVVSVQMARHEKGVPILAILQGLSGAFVTAIFFIPTLLWGVAAFSAGRDPQLTVLVHECAWLTFVTFATFFPLQIVPIAIVSLTQKAHDRTTAFPRWIGYATLWLAVTGEAGPLAQLFKTGPFAWDGLLSYYLVFVLFAIWMATLTYLIWRAVGRQELAQAS